MRGYMMSDVLMWLQEGYLNKYNVSDEDRMLTGGEGGEQDEPMDPMQGLEAMDVAGPRQQ